MAEHSRETPHTDSVNASPMIQLLERLDNFFHMIVAVLFILMAAAVLVHTCVVLARQVPLLIPRPAAELQAGEAAGATGETGAAHVEPHAGAASVDPFLHNSLDILSSILFIVIILELLRTILTYLQTHNIQAIMQEFIVVGIISSVRKILLVGAESSLAGSKGIDFIQEATGTILSIGGILALIFGLLLLQRAFDSKKQTA